MTSNEEIDSLRSRVCELEEELGRVKEQLASCETHPDEFEPYADGRDQAVLNQLDQEDVVTSPQLQRLYRTQTDIRNKQTAVSRVKAITKTPLFEHIDRGKWRFTGGEVDD